MSQTRPRGRPATHSPDTTDAQRATLSRTKRLQSGARPLSIMLTPETSESLAYGMAITGESITAFVCRSINDEAKRLGRTIK